MVFGPWGVVFVDMCLCVCGGGGGGRGEYRTVRLTKARRANKSHQMASYLCVKGNVRTH